MDESGAKLKASGEKKKEGEDGGGSGGGLCWKSVIQSRECTSYGGGRIGGGGFSGGTGKKTYGSGGSSFVSPEAQDVVRKVRENEGHGSVTIYFLE